MKKREIWLWSLLFLALIATGLFQLLRPEDPLARVPTGGRLSLTSEETEVVGNRRWRHLSLKDDELGHIGITLSEPLKVEKPLPLIILLGGLPTAEANLGHMPEVGDNIVLAYDWPFDPYLPEEPVPLVRALPEFHRGVTRIPGQVLQATGWVLDHHEKVNDQRLMLVGFSLGCEVTPVIKRLAQIRGYGIDHTVLAFGGSPVGEVLANHPAFKKTRLKLLARLGGDLFLDHLDPAMHAPYMDGEFLVVYGTRDQLVPVPAARRLADAVPQPKEVRVIKASHMDVDQDEQMRLLLKVIGGWMTRQSEAINPFPIPQGQ